MKPLQFLALLKWPIVGAVLLASLGAVTVVMAQREYAAAVDAHQRAAERHAQAMRELQRAQQNEDAVRSAIARYDSLSQSGLIGAEHRLAWIETLDAARVSLGVERIAYDILPQRRMSSEGSPQALEWMESRMRLNLRVRHAGVLLGVLEALQGVSSAIVRPERCRVAWAEDAASGLSAECELRWLTLRTEAHT